MPFECVIMYVSVQLILKQVTLYVYTAESACLRWMDEVEVRSLLLTFGVFGAVDLPVEHGVSDRLEDGHLSLLSLATHLTLKNVVVFYILETGQMNAPIGEGGG